MFDALESRTLFSAPLSLKSGTLTVNGGSGHEIISLAQVSSSKLNASITRSDGSVSQKTYNIKDITRIVVRAGDGNDHVYASTITRSFKKGISVDCGGGNDLVVGPMSGKFSVTGGPGRDIISVGRVTGTFDLKDGGVDSLTCPKDADVKKDKKDNVTWL